MKKWTASLMLLVLAGCGSLPKASPQAALYDFGITGNLVPVALPVRLASVQAAPGLDGSEIRYRLAYKNPAQVFAYTESRWTAAPDKLLQRRLAQRLQTAGVPACTLHVTVEAFDQVFDTPASSRAVVQLHAMLVKGAGRQALTQTTQVGTERVAASADARGGVAALDAASEDAVAGIMRWVATQDCK